MDVSIIVINYNTFDLTCQCIETIYAETRDITFEVIVVDNASTEKNPDGFVARFPLIKLVKSEVNKGFAGGNNLGISIADGKFILLLNSDAQFLNNVALILRDFLVRNAKIAAVSGKLTYPDGRVQHNCQRFPSVRAKLFELLRGQKIIPRSVAGKILFGAFFDHNTVAFPDWIWGTCFMFRREILRQLPGEKLAENFFMYGEDVQWCLEFKRLGFGVAFDPSAHVIHLMGKSGARKEKMMQENGVIFMNMYYSLPHRFFIRILDRLLTASVRGQKSQSA